MNNSNDFIKVNKGDIDFDNIYNTCQIPTGTGNPVNALPEWWDDVNPEVGTLYMDSNNGLVYEVQSDGSPVPMGFLGQNNYNQIIDKSNPTPESETNPSGGTDPQPDQNPGPSDTDPQPDSNSATGSSTSEKISDEYEYGYHGSGIADLVGIINNSHKATENVALSTTGTIKNTAREYWEGVAEIEYEGIIDRDSVTFSNKIFDLFNAAITDINNAGVEYQNFDKRLMDDLS